MFPSRKPTRCSRGHLTSLSKDSRNLKHDLCIQTAIKITKFYKIIFKTLLVVRAIEVVCPQGQSTLSRGIVRPSSRSAMPR